MKIASKRGLASASKEMRQRVASLGGRSVHPNGRGMQNVPQKKRIQIARLGGMAAAAKKK